MAHLTPRPVRYTWGMTTSNLSDGHWGHALLAGLAGAVAVTALNETARRILPHAPRLEVLGERGLSASLKAVGVQPPEGEALFYSTLAADLASNALYYSLVALRGKDGALALGGGLGLAAGVGAVVLPRPLGLGEQPGSRNPQTPVLTTLWYLAGGLAAGAAYRELI